MLQDQRELLVNRIMAGYLRYNRLKIISPSFSILYEASLVHKNTYEEALNSGVLDDIGMLEILISNGLWDDSDQYNLDKLPKDIESKKVELYESRNKSNAIPAIKKELESLKLHHNELFSKRYAYNSHTCDGVANFYKNAFIIRRTCFLGNKLYNFSGYSLDYVMYYVQSNVISEETLRELGRTEPWQSHWIAIKNGIYKLAEPTEDQRKIIRISSFYDNLHQSSDCPPDWVIEDDDMLDGFLISQRKTRETASESNNLERALGRNAGCGEVFVVCDDEDPNALFGTKDVHKIYERNDAYAKAAQFARNKKIEENGMVCEVDLPDVKKKLQMEMARAGV